MEVGFGSARLDTAWSGSYYGVALDVFHGLDYGRSVSYPWTFPGNGRPLPLLAYDGRGEPNPLTACPGYTPPTGPVLIAAFGEGEVQVAESSLLDGSTALAHCVVTAGNYINPNPKLAAAGADGAVGAGGGDDHPASAAGAGQDLRSAGAHHGQPSGGGVSVGAAK